MTTQEELNDAGAPGYGLTVRGPSREFYRSLLRLRSSLSPFYPTADEQDIWMTIPHPLLRGDAAMDLLDTERESEVWALVQQLESGAIV